MSNPSGVLVSGSGEGNQGLSTVWGYAVVDGVVSFVLFLILAFAFQETNINWKGMFMGGGAVSRQFGGASYMMLILGIGSIVAAICVGNVVAQRIKGTNVKVYEDRVEGMAVDKDFSVVKLILMFMGWNKAKLTGFDLAMNQITSVDLGPDNSIILNASAANYKCFVSNGPEIQAAINNKIKGA